MLFPFSSCKPVLRCACVGLFLAALLVPEAGAQTLVNDGLTHTVTTPQDTNGWIVSKSPDPFMALPRSALVP